MKINTFWNIRNLRKDTRRIAQKNNPVDLTVFGVTCFHYKTHGMFAKCCHLIKPWHPSAYFFSL